MNIITIPEIGRVATDMIRVWQWKEFLKESNIKFNTSDLFDGEILTNVSAIEADLFCKWSDTRLLTSEEWDILITYVKDIKEYRIYPNMYEWTTSVSNTSRVLRGGSWLNLRGYARASSRDHIDPAYRNDNVGFRVVLR